MKSLSRVQLFATPWTAAHQAPLSVGFSRQEYEWGAIASGYMKESYRAQNSLQLKLQLGFPCGSSGKESTCNAGDLSSIPGLRRSPGKGKGYPVKTPHHSFSLFSSVAQSCLTLYLHGPQHTRPPCPSPTSRACSNSCPLSRSSRPL